MVQTVCLRSEKIERFFETYSKAQFSHMHTEMLKRYKDVDTAVLEERIGRKYFRAHMKSSITLLKQSCFHANGIARLALDLLRRNTDDMEKRQILGSAALSFSLYNKEELHELSSKVSSTIQNQKHIVQGMNLVMNETDKIRGNMVDLQQEFSQLLVERNLSMIEFEHSITEFTLLTPHENHVQIHEIERLTDVIYTGFNGRLSPKTLTGDTLRKAVKELENKAYEEGFKLISNTLSHIYEMDTSVLYHNRETLLVVRSRKEYIKVISQFHLPPYLKMWLQESGDMWFVILTWSMMVTSGVYGNHHNLKRVNSPFEVEIPLQEPTFHEVNSSFIFKSVGILYPTISYIHLPEPDYDVRGPGSCQYSWAPASDFSSPEIPQLSMDL